MGRIDDPTSGAWEEFDRRLAALESRVPLSDSAVSGGRTRFIGQNSFLIQGSGGVSGTLTIDGLEVVDGELRIRGQLNVTGPTSLGGATTIGGATKITGDTTVSGEFDLNGPLSVDGKATINGDTTVTGPFHVDGNTDFDGNLQIKGTTDITGDTSVRGPFHVTGRTNIDGDTTVGGNMTVEPGGYIIVDDMTIGRIPGTSQAGIRFGIGQLRSTGDRTVLQSGDAIVGVRSNQVALLYGNLGIEVFSSGVYLEGVGFPPAGIQLFPVVTDSNGKLYRAPASN
jgi:cytoskeletal protein CcmA (bactofilin family)